MSQLYYFIFDLLLFSMYLLNIQLLIGLMVNIKYMNKKKKVQKYYLVIV